MNDTQVLTVAASLVATLFGMLIMILGWLGNKVYTKLDEMSKSLTAMASELHSRINGLDRRLVKVETHCGGAHHSFKPED